MSLFATIFSSLLAVTAWAQSPVCTSGGDFWIVQDSQKQLEILVCSQKGKDQTRLMNGSEIKILIAQTRDSVPARLKWKQILKITKTPLSAGELLAISKRFHDQQTYPMRAKEFATIQWLGEQYSRLKLGTSAPTGLQKNKKAISRKNNMELEASLMRSHMLSCIDAGGTLQVSEEGTACACGRSEFSNFQDFACISRQVVRYDKKKRMPTSADQQNGLSSN